MSLARDILCTRVDIAGTHTQNPPKGVMIYTPAPPLPLTLSMAPMRMSVKGVMIYTPGPPLNLSRAPMRIPVAHSQGLRRASSVQPRLFNPVCSTPSVEPRLFNRLFNPVFVQPRLCSTPSLFNPVSVQPRLCSTPSLFNPVFVQPRLCPSVALRVARECV